MCHVRLAPVLSLSYSYHIRAISLRKFKRGYGKYVTRTRHGRHTDVIRTNVDRGGQIIMVADSIRIWWEFDTDLILTAKITHGCDTDVTRTWHGFSPAIYTDVADIYGIANKLNVAVFQAWPCSNTNSKQRCVKSIYARSIGWTDVSFWWMLTLVLCQLQFNISHSYHITAWSLLIHATTSSISGHGWLLGNHYSMWLNSNPFIVIKSE